jgi:Zn-dependent alcohol dehydrogenase
MKIRAAILEEIGRKPPYAVSRPLTIDEVELAPSGRGEVLVKIAAAGLCHSDLSVIDADFGSPERYGAFSFFETIPSSPRWQTAANIFPP